MRRVSPNAEPVATIVTHVLQIGDTYAPVGLLTGITYMGNPKAIGIDAIVEAKMMLAEGMGTNDLATAQRILGDALDALNRAEENHEEETRDDDFSYTRS